jgi:hypothetical protein
MQRIHRGVGMSQATTCLRPAPPPPPPPPPPRPPGPPDGLPQTSPGGAAAATRPPCTYWARGTCTKGAACPFAHTPTAPTGGGSSGGVGAVSPTAVPAAATGRKPAAASASSQALAALLAHRGSTAAAAVEVEGAASPSLTAKRRRPHDAISAAVAGEVAQATPSAKKPRAERAVGEAAPASRPPTSLSRPLVAHGASQDNDSGTLPDTSGGPASRAARPTAAGASVLAKYSATKKTAAATATAESAAPAAVGSRGASAAAPAPLVVAPASSSAPSLPSAPAPAMARLPSIDSEVEALVQAALDDAAAAGLLDGDEGAGGGGDLPLDIEAELAALQRLNG